MRGRQPAARRGLGRERCPTTRRERCRASTDSDVTRPAVAETCAPSGSNDPRRVKRCSRPRQCQPLRPVGLSSPGVPRQLARVTAQATPPANPPAMAQDIPVESTEILYDHDAREVNLNMKVKNTMAPLPPQGHVAASHEPHQAGRGAGQPGAQHEDGRVGVQAVHDVPWRAISARTQGHQPPAGPPCSRACVVVLFAKGLDIDSSKLKWVATT